jgi:hypothetical protein
VSDTGSVGWASSLYWSYLPFLYWSYLPQVWFHLAKLFQRRRLNLNQRLSRACIVHLVIKKTNWSYVKTMSCSGSHLGITINIKKKVRFQLIYKITIVYGYLFLSREIRWSFWFLFYVVLYWMISVAKKPAPTKTVRLPLFV